MRLKEETKSKILEAAMHIAKKEGWQALSMRKIADEIEYTAPIIYEYFSNKGGILVEISRRGYLVLAQYIREAKAKYEKPKEQVEAMWIAHWDFAFANREFYQLMFGVEMICCEGIKTIPEAVHVREMLVEAIEALYENPAPAKDDILIKYYTYLSIMHGLISINLVHPDAETNESMNKQILHDAINGITLSINN